MDTNQIENISDLIRVFGERLDGFAARIGVLEQACKQIKELTKESNIFETQLELYEYKFDDLLKRVNRAVWLAEQAGKPVIPLEARAVEELGLSVRLANNLDALRIRTIGQLCERTEADLLKCRNFGPKCLKEVRVLLEDHGLTLKQESDYGKT